jgi:predicted transcriptional regulator
MPSNIVGATKLSAQLQTSVIDYGEEAKWKLRQSSDWGFVKGLKRGRLEIMAGILCYCNQQKAKTDIMYNVNLNYAQLKKYLKSLMSQGLLATSKNKFATTQKGRRFLELFVQLSYMLES